MRQFALQRSAVCASQKHPASRGPACYSAVGHFASGAWRRVAVEPVQPAPGATLRTVLCHAVSGRIQRQRVPQRAGHPYYLPGHADRRHERQRACERRRRAVHTPLEHQLFMAYQRSTKLTSHYAQLFQVMIPPLKTYHRIWTLFCSL